MKKIIVLFFILVSCLLYAAEIKISDLPVGRADTTSTTDVIPFVDMRGPTTRKMRLADLVNLPSMSTSFAPSLITDSNVSCNANILQSKIAGLTARLLSFDNGFSSNATKHLVYDSHLSATSAVHGYTSNGASIDSAVNLKHAQNTDTDLAEGASLSWSKVNKSGSLIGDIDNVSSSTAAMNDVMSWGGSEWLPKKLLHNDLSNKQGGQSSEYYHLNSSQHTKATQLATETQDGLMSSTNIVDMARKSSSNIFVGDNSFSSTATFDNSITVKQQASATNPESGYNRIYSKNDDSLYIRSSTGVETQIGTGGTSSSLPYANYISNYGAEVSTVDWGASAGTLSRETTNVYRGSGSFKWVSDATADTMYSTTVSVGEDTHNAAASFYYDTTSTSMEVAVFDSAGNNVSGYNLLTATTNFIKSTISFVASLGSSYKLQFKSGGSSQTIYVDDVYMGNNYMLGEVSQASLFGSKTWTTTTNCEWSRSTTSLGDFTADADCDDNARVFEGNAIADASNDGQLPQIRLRNVKAGHYKVVVSGAMLAEKTGTSVYGTWSISDGTNQFSYSPTYMADGTSNAKGLMLGEHIFNYTYTTSQSEVTLKLQCNPTGTCYVFASSQPVKISVYYYPTASETVARFDNIVIPSGWEYTSSSESSCSSTSATPAICKAAGFANNTKYGNAADGDSSTSFSVKYPNLTPGEYEVDASAIFKNEYASSTTSCNFILSDGSKSIYTFSQTTSTDSIDRFSSIKGNFRYTSIGDRIFSVSLARTGGGGTCTIAMDADSFTGSINIKQISESISMPQIVNSVGTTYAGQIRAEFSVIGNTGTPTVVRQSGFISSLTDTDVGKVTANFVSGTFSESPVCTCTAGYSATLYTCTVLTGDKNYMTFNTYKVSDGSAVDTTMHITCMGKR